MKRITPGAVPITTAHNAGGESVSLGRELGRGGEGVVYELLAHPELVAKLYHVAPAATKQAKLRLMADSIDSPLRKYAAWPEETLHDASGAVIGFTMQRVEQRLPIHMLYSPAQRRESFPKARFDFLVFVARNIAAAFETLHAHGHVLGDVNQGNVLVGDDSRVILIDCDSFQIEVGDALHRCEVGVAHFTPPELQSVSSFVDVTRTPNHDGFGLALLIFHLLMGGRHPFSGVPLAENVGDSLEADIREFRYAYASDATQRLIAPPPKSVPIDTLPPRIIALLDQAFSECGAQSRPSPLQWVAALDEMREQLQLCAKRPMHLYSGGLEECSWCALDRRRVTLFGALATPTAAPAPVAGIDLEAMERALAPRLSWPAVARFEWPQWHSARWMAPHGPAESNDEIEMRLITHPVAMLIGVGLVVLMALNGAGEIAIVTGSILALFELMRRTLRTTLGDKDRPEWINSQSRYEQAVARLREFEAQRDEANGSAALEAWRSAHRRLQLHLKSNARAIANVSRQAHQHGLRQALAARAIRDAPWAIVPEHARERLRAAGIETAADFDASTLERLRFLTEPVVRSLLDWRARIGHDYQRQHRASHAPDVVAASRERARKQHALEQELLAAFQVLQRHVADPEELSELQSDIATCEAIAKREFNRWHRVTGQQLP